MESRKIALAGMLIAAFAVVAIPSQASAQIVALGSSAVHGAVREDQMWPAVLEDMMRAKGSHVHVTNAGVWGSTSGETLGRLPSAVPAGTKIVILMQGGFNDARKLPEGAAHAAENIAAIKRQLKARGIRVIDALGIYRAVLRQPDMALRDHIHLTVEGNRRVAEILARMLR